MSNSQAQVIPAIIFSICFSGAMANEANAQDQSNPPATNEASPTLVVLLSGSSGDSLGASQVYGLELQYNWTPGVQNSFAVGFHGMLQNQQWGDLDADRWGLGVSANYYFKFESFRPYIGVKRTYYGGFGQTGEALDCLQCSDVDESYDGGETFATIGLLINRFTFQIDTRISNDRSSYSEAGNDPWGVGATWYDRYDGIPDPDYIFSVGYAF